MNITNDLLIDEIKSVRKYNELYKIPFKIGKGNDSNGVKMGIICAACNGFGDYVYALKIYGYIKEWYNIDPVIFSNNPKYFIENGIKSVYGIKIPGKRPSECTDIKKTKIYKVNKNGDFLGIAKIPYRFDVMGVCPFIDTDFDPDYKVIKRLFPYANRFNSLLFSTYNVRNPKIFDFPTGLGDGYMGLLLSDNKSELKRHVNLQYPYIMAHISSHESVNAEKCFKSFVKLMCEKYSDKYDVLDIITPKAVSDSDFLKKLSKYIIKNGYYETIEIINKYEKKDYKEKVLRFRLDILPLPYKEYISLFDYCLPDVLLTGNQSVTDVVSCCKYYNVYYQIMPWETSFARNLNNILGAKDDYLRKISTSCGYSKMSKSRKGKLIKIQQKWDFRKLAKPKLDSIIYNIKSLNDNEIVKSFVDIVNTSRKKQTVISKMEKLNN